MTVEYRCGNCREKTDPPAPYKMYVLCPCGRMTSATAAAVRLSEPKVLEPVEQSPTYDQAYVSSLEAEVERLKLRVQELESRKGE
jgi:hypothetical protein